VKNCASVGVCFVAARAVVADYQLMVKDCQTPIVGGLNSLLLLPPNDNAVADNDADSAADADEADNGKSNGARAVLM
jgi:hypothetical protein